MSFVIGKDNDYGRALLYLNDYLIYTSAIKPSEFDIDLTEEQILIEYKRYGKETIRKMGTYNFKTTSGTGS